MQKFIHARDNVEQLKQKNSNKNNLNLQDIVSNTNISKKNNKATQFTLRQRIVFQI
ncbi:unnamed protein product [Paramecium sonneborni]|uniref:Uncharacterized protein n=1 Tax=Paramecium sonneborni TaxID=65129 RepID=A0A8S1RRC3_9CILI|nr:unnamed protein product [Paramecium sonneborni]